MSKHPWRCPVPLPVRHGFQTQSFLQRRLSHMDEITKVRRECTAYASAAGRQFPSIQDAFACVKDRDLIGVAFGGHPAPRVGILSLLARSFLTVEQKRNENTPHPRFRPFGSRKWARSRTTHPRQKSGTQSTSIQDAFARGKGWNKNPSGARLWWSPNFQRCALTPPGRVSPLTIQIEPFSCRLRPLMEQPWIPNGI